MELVNISSSLKASEFEGRTGHQVIKVMLLHTAELRPTPQSSVLVRFLEYCPGRLWSLLLWRYSRPTWTRSSTACCR